MKAVWFAIAGFWFACGGASAMAVVFFTSGPFQDEHPTPWSRTKRIGAIALAVLLGPVPWIYGAIFERTP